MEPHRVRLSMMMFGQYLIFGAWVVTLATYLMASPMQGGLNFPPSYAGWIYSTLAIAGIFAPMVTGLLADRLFAAQKLMAVFQFLGAVLIGVAAAWCASSHPEIEARYRLLAECETIGELPLLEAEQSNHRTDVKTAIREAQQRINQHPEMGQLVRRTFWPLFGIMVAYSFTTLMTLILCTVTAMRNLRDPKRNFSSVRLWGTVGWIVTGILIAFGRIAISPIPLYLAAAFSLLMGVFCLYLPHTPPSGKASSLGEAFGLPALKLFGDRSFLVLILCAFLLAISQQFWTVYANRYLVELGTPFPTATQTIAQVAEVISMAALVLLIPRVGLKWLMVLGMFLLAARNGAFIVENAWIVVLLGLPLHGVSYAFYSVTASIYVDQKAPGDLRASVQGIMTFTTMGGGTLLGNWLSGEIVQSQTLGSEVNWSTVWLVPTVMCIVVAIAFMVLFRDEPPEERMKDEG